MEFPDKLQKNIRIVFFMKEKITCCMREKARLHRQTHHGIKAKQTACTKKCILLHQRLQMKLKNEWPGIYNGSSSKANLARMTKI